MPADDQFELHLPAPPATGDTPLVPARMVNEFVYCPRRAELGTQLRGLVKAGEDHVLLIDVGPADKTEPAVESIGKTFARIERRATVI